MSVARNARWTVAANAYFVVCQAAVLLAVARLGSPRMVGQLALALALAAPVQLLLSLQLRSAQATDVRGEFGFREYLHLRALGATIAVVATVALAWWSGLAVAVTAAVALMKAVESLSDVAYGRMQRDGRFARMAASLFARGTLAVIVAATILAATGDLAAAILAIAAAWLAVFLVLDLEGLGGATEDAPAPVDRGRLWTLLRTSIPLGLAACVGSVAASTPRWLLYGVAGEEAVGYFAALAYVVVLGALFASAIGQAACPELAASFESARARFVRLTLGTAAVVSLASVLAVVVAAADGARLLSLLYGAPYAAHAPAFTWLVVAGGLAALASLLNYALTATRRFTRVLAVQVATGAAMLLVGLVRIPAAGLLGAAQATVCGNAVGVGVLVALLVAADGGRHG